MKRVMRIQGQGKVKDVGLKVLATMLALENLDAKIALIRAHPLGTSAIAETLTAEVTALMGKWYHRSGGPPSGLASAGGLPARSVI